MISIRAAQDLVLTKTPMRRRVARRSIEQAVDRVLAEDISARTDLPPFDRTTRDGFAVRSADVSTVPAVLNVVGEVAAGDSGDGCLVGPGQAYRVYTGAILPEGADAVATAPDAELERDDRVLIKAPISGFSMRKLRTVS